MKQKYFLSAPLLLFISFLLLCSELGKGKEIPPCTCVPLIYYERGAIQHINQDTAIVFDTCGLVLKYSTCDSAFVQNLYRFNSYYDSTIKKVYAKYRWDIFFFKDAIKLPIYPRDSTVFVTWEAIDTSFKLERAIFKNLDSIFGRYKLKKVFPAAISGDLSRIFELSFENWVSAVEVEQFININLYNYKNLCHCEFKWPTITAGTDIPDQSQSPYIITLNPDNTNLHISSNAEPIINYAIYNLLGNAISQSYNINYENALDIDISNLPTGIYLLRLHAPNHSHSIKFIKE